jgi:hypothetical protein
MITPLQLFTHLWDTYRTINQSDQTVDGKCMCTQWNPAKIIESLFEQLQEGQDFAKQVPKLFPMTNAFTGATKTTMSPDYSKVNAKNGARNQPPTKPGL